MNLSTAQKYAAQIVEWLEPLCERIEIAGSVRRQRPNCNDVDVVAVPKVKRDVDMFGTITSERNLLWEFLDAHVKSGKATFQSGGNAPGKFAILQLKKCQLDVFFATAETFASRFLCRTGSKEHNVWLATRAQERLMKWEPYEGVRYGHVTLPAASESDIYRHLGLDFIAPSNRDAEWLRKNLGAKV